MRCHRDAQAFASAQALLDDSQTSRAVTRPRAHRELATEWVNASDDQVSVPLPEATGTGGCLDSDAMQYRRDWTVKLDTDGIGQAARPGGHGDSGSVALATPPGPPQAS
jgi:hypothetical protein